MLDVRGQGSKILQLGKSERAAAHTECNTSSTSVKRQGCLYDQVIQLEGGPEHSIQGRHLLGFGDETLAGLLQTSWPRFTPHRKGARESGLSQ